MNRMFTMYLSNLKCLVIIYRMPKIQRKGKRKPPKGKGRVSILPIRRNPVFNKRKRVKPLFT